MGWYVTCKNCGQEEKYKHPNCGCLYNSYILLLGKLRGAQVIETFHYDNDRCKYTCIKYNNNVYTMKIISTDEWFTPSPYATKISVQEYNRHKLYLFNYTKESLDQLFVFHQFLNHQDILSNIAPILNNIGRRGCN